MFTGIQYQNVLLVVTDAAPYMVSAVKSLKILFPKMLHITCLAHGLHRIADFVRTQFGDVNSLIANCKAVFLKVQSKSFYVSSRFINFANL